MLTLDRTRATDVEHAIRPPMAAAVTIPTSEPGIVVYVADTRHGNIPRDHTSSLLKVVHQLATKDEMIPDVQPLHVFFADLQELRSLTTALDLFISKSQRDAADHQHTAGVCNLLVCPRDICGSEHPEVERILRDVIDVRDRLRLLHD